MSSSGLAGECYESCPIARANRAALLARLDDPRITDEERGSIASIYSPTERMVQVLSGTCDGVQQGECGSIFAVNAAQVLYDKEYDSSASPDLVLRVLATDPENGQFSIVLSSAIREQPQLLAKILEAIGEIGGVESSDDPYSKDSGRVKVQTRVKLAAAVRGLMSRKERE